MAKSPRDPYRHIRRQVPRPGWGFRSPKDYDRRAEKEHIEEGLKEVDNIEKKLVGKGRKLR